MQALRLGRFRQFNWFKRCSRFGRFERLNAVDGHHFVDKVAARSHAVAQTVSPQARQEHVGIRVGGQHDQSMAADAQVRGELGGEALRDVLRAPGVVQVVARHTSIVRRIEEDDVEALVGNGGEEVPLADVDVEVVEHGIDARAADRARVDVDRDDAAAASCGGEPTGAGAAAQVQDSAGAWQKIGTSELGDKIGARAEELRVEHVGKNDELESVDGFQDGALVLAAVDQRESCAQ